MELGYKGQEVFVRQGNRVESGILKVEATEKNRYWVVPEKIHTPPPPRDGILKILAGGGGVKDSGNPGRRGVKLEKVFCRGHFDQ